jgi:hypothetical protein
LFLGLTIALACAAGCAATPSASDDAYTRGDTAYLRSSGDGYRREDRVIRNEEGAFQRYQLKLTTPD